MGGQGSEGWWCRGQTELDDKAEYGLIRKWIIPLGFKRIAKKYTGTFITLTDSDRALFSLIHKQLLDLEDSKATPVMM